MRYLIVSFMRFLRILCYAVLVMLAFAAGAVGVLTLTDRGRDNLAGLISDAASSPGQTVRVSGIDGIWAGPLTVGNLVLEDAEGPWLVARGVEVDWSPLALFSATLEADRIFASRVELARLPKADATPKNKSASTLPLNLSLKQIDLPDVALGEALAGGVAAISAKGALRAEASPLQIETDFKVARTDGHAGEADGALRFVPDQNLLDINLRASEPAGGILANLLRLPGAPPVELSVMGSGPAADWKVSGTFAVDGAVVTRVEGRRQLTAKGSTIEAKGDGDFERFMPEMLRPLLAGKTVFDIAGTATSAGGIDIERATIESTGLRGSATGAIDPEGASDFAIEVSATGAGVPLSFGSAESPIDMVLQSASIRALGDGRQPNLDIGASLSKVSTNFTQLDDVSLVLHSDGFDVQRRIGPVTGGLTAGRLTLDNPTIAPLVAGKITAELSGTLTEDSLAFDKGSFRSDAIAGALNGNVSLADGSITLELKADVAAAALPASIRPALGEKVAISGKIVRDTEGHVSANPFALSSGGLSASGTIQAANEAVDVDIEGKLADVGALVKDASGAVDFTLTGAGALSAPDVALTVTSDRIEAAGREITGLKLTATGKADAANPAADVSLTGTMAGEALDGKASLATAAGTRSIKGLSLALGGNKITGDLVLDENFLPLGDLAFALPDIGPLAALANQTAQGDMTGTIRFSSDGGKPQVALDAQAVSVSRGDVSAKDVAISAEVVDYLAAPAISGKVRAATVTSGTTVARDIDVTLTRDGSWTGFDGGATVAGIPAKASGRLQVADGGVVVELASGEAALQDFKATLAQPSTIRVAGGVTTLDGLTLDVAGGTAVVSGTAGAALDVTATFSAQQEGTQLTFGGSESPINLTVKSASMRAAGPAGAPALDISATLSKVSTKSASIDDLELALHSAAFNIGSRTGPVTGNAVAGAFVIDNPNIAPLVSGVLKAEFAGTLTADALSVTSGTLSSGAFAGAFGGDVSLADGSISLQLKADVASAALPAAVRGLLGERTAVAGKVVRDAAGNLSADSLSIVSGALNAAGRLRVEEKTIDADISGKLADVSLLASDASGAIDFAATIKGERSTPDVSLTVTSGKIVASGREIDNLKLVATGKADAANPAADVSLTGTVAGEALDGKATLATSEGKREVKGLSLALGQNRISGDLVLDENFLPLGTVNFTLPDIGPLAALALETAEGDLAGTISFTEPGGKPQIALDAKTAAIARGDISAKGVAISATIADYLAAPAISGKVQAATVTSGTTIVRDIDVTLTRDGPWTGFDGGATVADIPARASGRLQIAGGKTIIELASGQATVRGIKAALARASKIEIAAGVTTLDKLALDLGGGSAVVSGTAGAALNLTATLAAVPASLANSFALGLNATGSISGTAKITGAASNPTVGYSIDWKGAQTAQTLAAGFGAMTISSRGDFAGGRLTFDANVGDGSGLGMKGGGTVDTTSRALSLDFNGSVPFAFLTRRLAAQGLSLSGAADVSLQVRGPMGSPAIGGTVRASGARFVDARSGIAINDINAEISLGGGTATIRSLNGTLSTGGGVSASGTVGIDPARGFPADLSVKISDGRYTDGRVVTATMSGDLSIKGALVSAPTLSGTINLAKTVITVPERLPGSLSTLNVKHKNAPAAVRVQDQAMRPADTSSGGTGGLTLDVTVNATNQIFIQGRGLDAELGGSLRLTGSAGSPQAIGQFTLRRGRLSILGKRLNFTEGTITFSGSLVPYLDLTAESTAGDATVVVTVTGQANNPKFAFSSIPALPEDEVLARLIFGRSMSNLSPIQIAQLAEAAAQFAGVGGSTSLLENLRSKIGVDDLDVKTNEKGDTAVAVGKYLNDRTYVTIEKGDKAGSGKATIDLNVGRGVKLRGEATDDGEAKGGIFFEKEY